MSLFNIVQVTAGSVPTAPTGTYIVFLDSADGILKKKDDAGVVTAASPGEVNTASNVGSGSGTEYGVFKQKTGVDLELKKIKQGANITLTENLSDITIAATSGGTDLGSTGNGTSLTVSSSTGTNASVPAATTSAWGAMTDEDKTKLDGIAAAAQPGVVTTLTTTGSGAASLVGATLNVPTPASGNTLYSADDTLAGARTVNMNSLALGFTNAAAGVAIGTATADASSILDLTSTTEGFLPPRMTTVQMNAIGSPAEGLMIFDTTTKQWMGYNGTSWVILG